MFTLPNSNNLKKRLITLNNELKIYKKIEIASDLQAVYQSQESENTCWIIFDSIKAIDMDTTASFVNLDVDISVVSYLRTAYEVKGYVAEDKMHKLREVLIAWLHAYQLDNEHDDYLKFNSSKLLKRGKSDYWYLDKFSYTTAREFGLTQKETDNNLLKFLSVYGFTKLINSKQQLNKTNNIGD